MQFILGLLTAIVFFLCLATASYIGYKQGKNKHKTIPIDDEEKQRRERYDNHFKAMFAYDVETAIQRKKVR